MTFARFQSAMSRTEQNGAAYRAHLEASGRAGNPLAIAALEEPPFPDAIDYLWRWCLELRQGLGAGMDGLASITWTALDAWARRTHRKPRPHEVEALFAIDGALREGAATPTNTTRTNDDAPTQALARASQWPSKKAAAAGDP